MEKQARDRQFELLKAGKSLTARQVEDLEAQISSGSQSMEHLVQLLGYLSAQSKTSQKVQASHFQHILKLIPEIESCGTALTHQIKLVGFWCSPKQFGVGRSAWLAQIEIEPTNPKLLGCAGQFIIWRDFETAELLLRRAIELDPGNSQWSACLCQYSYFEFKCCLSKYKLEYAQRVLAYGRIALGLGVEAGWIDLDYVTDCAIYLGEYDIASICASELAKLGDEEPPFRQVGNSYLGRIALRKGNVSESIRFLLLKEPGYVNSMKTWQLARELCAEGEEQAVIECIDQYKQIVPKAIREKWIEEIRQGLIPDFEGASHFA